MEQGDNSPMRGPVLIQEGLWWVGYHDPQRNLACNPYLLVHEGSAVLFDPGSVLDCKEVLENVQTIVPLSAIEAIVLSHQDPDLCSAIPYFEKAGFSGVLCCHERAAMLIQFYGTTSPFYEVNKQGFHYTMKSGLQLRFIFAPYLHFPGAIMTYLPSMQVLVSGDLFGAVQSAETWTLYATDEYSEAMKAFHESYMPSREIMQPVMSQLLLLEINIICPQHGSVIHTAVREHIRTLRDLPCGIFQQGVRTSLLDSGGVTSLLGTVLKRYHAIYGSDALMEVCSNSGFIVDYQTREITSSEFPVDEQWNAFFLHVAQTKGMPWLTSISPFVENLCSQYGLPLPMVFESIVFNAEMNADIMNSRYQELENRRIELEAEFQKAQESLTRCPITGLYNKEFFIAFMSKTLGATRIGIDKLALLVLTIDSLMDININFGSDEGNNTMRNLAYLMHQQFSDQDRLFRLEGGIFAIVLPGATKEQALQQASKFKTTVFESRMTIAPISISIGMYHSDELTLHKDLPIGERVSIMEQTARFRLRLAKKQGTSSLVYESSQQTTAKAAFTILLVDEEGLHRDLVRSALEQEHYTVLVAGNGLLARDLAEREEPDVIICEQMIPKLSGFTLRKQLLGSPLRRSIPFILLSHTKNERTVNRAIGLGIQHFLEKPVLLGELLGIVGLLTARSHGTES